MSHESGSDVLMGQIATDQLWKYQLRKENKALHEQVSAIRMRRESDTAEFHRKLKEGEEKMIALEIRLSEVERNGRKLVDQAQKEYLQQVTELKSEIRSFLELRVFKDDVQKTTSLQVADSPVTSLRVSSSEVSISESSEKCRPALIYSASPITPVNEGQKSTTDTDKLQTARRRTATRSTAERRQATRSTKSRGSPAEPLLATVASTTIPRLTQGTTHIKIYHTNANNIYHTLLIKDQQMETNFITAFIKGLRDVKSRDRLISELQQLHPSRNKKDDIAEILCEWDDIPEGLRKAGLLSV